MAEVRALNLFLPTSWILIHGADQSLGVKWIFESWSPLIGDPSLSCTRMLLESDQTDPKVATTWSRCLKDLKSVTLQIYTDASSTGYPRKRLVPLRRYRAHFPFSKRFSKMDLGKDKPPTALVISLRRLATCNQ